MNDNNKLNLKIKSNIKVVTLVNSCLTVAIPTRPSIADAKILQVFEDGSFTAHWNGNWNTDGDFRTELMRFDNNLVLDTGDLNKRNAVRRQNNLVEIQ